jgi:hypothetical protein
VHGRCIDPRSAARRKPCVSHDGHVPNVNNSPKDFGSRLLHQTKCAHCHGKVASRPCEVLARAQLVAQLVATSLNERPVHDDNIAGTTVWPLGRIACPGNLIQARLILSDTFPTILEHSFPLCFLVCYMQDDTSEVVPALAGTLFMRACCQSYFPPACAQASCKSYRRHGIAI